MVWLVFTLAVTLAFGRLAAHNLANYRPLSNDEGELMAVGYKLSTQGVLGSDMYAGFFGGDQHHFETLPLQHFLEATSFRVLGPGVEQARLVSLLAAVTLIWVVGWLAFRWYGLGTAVVGELLLVAWRSNLTAASDGLPLLGVARTARYDVLGVAMAWLAIAALDLTLRRPTPWRGALTGVFAGLAALSQFFGAFTLPVVIVMWVGSRRHTWRGATLVGIGAGFAVVVVPFVLYALTNASDLVGQLAVYGDRGAFLRPGFLLENITTEPARYTQFLTQWPPVLDISGSDLSVAPLSPWVLVIGIWPALVSIIWRRRSRGDRLLLASLVCFGGLLLLLDQTKTPLYAILLLPTVCLCLAAAAVRVVTWSLDGFRRAGLRLAVCGLAGVVGVCLALESVHAFQVDWMQASSVTPYLPLGEVIDSAITPGSPVLGPERWWWALHQHPYVSLRSIWFQWAALAARGQAPQFRDWVSRTHPDSVVVNINVRDDVRAFPAALQEQFWGFLDRCTTLTADIANPNYFETEVYAVNDDCR
ncbi:MAG TPA: hypothetical protein VF937_18090 [Chloroflexota bacterium]